MPSKSPLNFGSMGNDKYIFVVAEIGINHNGSLNLAKKLIDEAINAGCDAVKFQKRKIDVVYTEEFLNQPRESEWGNTQRDQKLGLEFDTDKYDEIDSYCKKKEILWFASSWDIESQKLMRKYKFPFNKIASAMATNKNFVKVVASEKVPTFASIGMTSNENVDWLVSTFKEQNCPLMLMHTVSTYPAINEHLNLKCINTLKKRYSIPIGYSGHEASVSPSIVAASIGASAIERHITIDRAMYGSDQSASLEPAGMKELVNIVRKIPTVLGTGKRSIISEEKKIATKLRYWLGE